MKGNFNCFDRRDEPLITSVDNNIKKHTYITKKMLKVSLNKSNITSVLSSIYILNWLPESLSHSD